MEFILNLYRRLLSLETVRTYLDVPALSTANIRGCLAETVFRDEHEHLVIERIIFPPSTELPSHRHPNVSVCDYGISGSGQFSVRGHNFSNDQAHPAKRPLYVPRNAPHGGVVGPLGATIVSFQYWHEWPPKESIFLDWETE